MPFEILYGPGLERVGGILLVHDSRCVLIIDENTTEEEAQSTIKWAKETLETMDFETARKATLEFFGLR